MALPHENGKFVQELICEDLGIVFVDEIVDAELDGKPYEIKSCQAWIHDEYNSRKRRRGRFKLNCRQHDYLVRNDGKYCFVVLNGQDILHRCEVMAMDLPFDIRGVDMGVTWNRVIEC